LKSAVFGMNKQGLAAAEETFAAGDLVTAAL
jgi:hypothetical protein